MSSGNYGPPVWSMPVAAIGLVAAVFGLVFWTSFRPVEPQVTTVTVDQAPAKAQDMSVFERERLECDRQVALLMSTKDMVELERARILIHELGCGVGKRLPPP